MTMRILMADDHPVVRMGYRKILEEVPGPITVEETSNGDETIEKATTAAFDVVLLDISMPGKSGIDVLRELKRLRPSLPVLMLSMYPEEEYAVRAFKEGASGYLSKKSAPEELVTAIKTVFKGRKYLSPSLGEFLASSLAIETEDPPHRRLSDREFHVMQMIVSGKLIKQIASELNLSPKTISTYRSRILQKINVENNAELIQYALKHRLFE
jgi:two-component system, NarL family, invasion response regulator UvrY